MEPFLSVVIPAYNEARRILATLEKVAGYLAAQGFSWEVVVVDDGSADATASLVEEYGHHHAGVTLLAVAHGGKGWAVKHGMLAARGAYRFLCDADLSMPIEQLERFLPPRLEHFDVAIGSRELPDSRRYDEPLSRHLLGRAFNWVVRGLAVPGIADTQCGFKCFLGPVAEELFALQRLCGFGFDVEVLFLARQRGLRVVEVPIDWYYQRQSKLHPLYDSLLMLRDVLSIRRNHWLQRYAHSPSSTDPSLMKPGDDEDN